MRSEFDFIQNLKNKYGLSKVGDDCAVLSKDDQTDMVVTADMLVEDIDFRLDWTTPELIGSKALSVSLSDIAAMGANPVFAMISLGVPESCWKTQFVDKFYDGWFTVARHYDVELIGGDLSRTPDKIVIDSTVIGHIAKGKAILRSGAKPGDSIYVTGELGGASAGLMLLESGFRYGKSNQRKKQLISRQLRPTPQVVTGKQLSALGLATAMIDLSDGVSSDLLHICKMSSVGARIYFENIPVNSNLAEFSLNAEQQAGLALSGGEDFELLFTADEKKISQANFQGVTRIGEITASLGIIEVVHHNGVSSLTPKGFRHF
ncbi:MAG: thiamine-phosphate kinase [Pyrinomonadaceae bacterium]